VKTGMDWKFGSFLLDARQDANKNKFLEDEYAQGIRFYQVKKG
jgi:hypothetical protein